MQYIITIMNLLGGVGYCHVVFKSVSYRKVYILNKGSAFAMMGLYMYCDKIVSRSLYVCEQGSRMLSCNWLLV